MLLSVLFRACLCLGLTGVLAASSAAVARRLDAAMLADPDPRTLAMRAVDAARSAGASYADIRKTLVALTAAA